MNEVVVAAHEFQVRDSELKLLIVLPRQEKPLYCTAQKI